MLAAGEAGAGASLRSEGELLYAVTASHNWATQRLDDHGDASDIGCRNTYDSLSNYVEYGYSYYYTLMGTLGVAQGKCADEEETGLGDLRLGLRGRINRYLNTRGWEVGVIVPISGEQLGRSRIGCGAFGAWTGVDFKDELVEDHLSVGYGGVINVWERPLAHEGRVDADLSGHITSRLSWQLEGRHQFPLTDVEAPPAANVVDCGTNAQATKLGTGLKFAIDRDQSVGCGYKRTVWGENTSRSQGFDCSYTYIWR